MIPAFCQWLSTTALSVAIQNAAWVIPSVQTVHILAIATVMASVVMVDFRLLGVTGRSLTIHEMVHRFLPWVWSAVIVLLISGTVLIIGEPERELMSPVFWVKMSLLGCVLLITGVFQYSLGRAENYWERRRMLSCVVAIGSLVLWVGIIAAGRWIAYVEHG
jgi:hypothetical protein